MGKDDSDDINSSYINNSEENEESEDEEIVLNLDCEIILELKFIIL